MDSVSYTHLDVYKRQVQGYPDNSFKPDRTVTRAEMAKVVTVAAGFNEYSKNMTSSYEDMHGHWAESYVELADVCLLYTSRCV